MVELFLLFDFCPPKVGPVVCVSCIYGKICAEHFFSSDGQTGLSEVIILHADD